MFTSTHRDNPAFWDRQAQEWTDKGKQYLATLERMTGARRKRFLLGLWAAAEGLVYDGYDPAVHHLPLGWEPPKEWRRVWGIDWGFVQPLVVQFWAVDGDKRMHLYREIYRTKTRVEEVAKECAALVATGAEPVPESILADHDPENVATFKAYGKYTKAIGGKDEAMSLPIRAADKRDRDKGIQLVQGLFDVQPDGKPRVMFRPDARRHQPDQTLLSEGKPTGTVEELMGYTWKVPKADQAKDEPIEHNDHAMDAMRYVAVSVNNDKKLMY
jgi:phage terminase large subunit